MRSLTNYLSTALLALGLSLGSASVAGAQTDADRAGPGGDKRTATANNTPAGRTNDGFNWGLLGLLGLAGLIPLFVRRDDGHHHRERATAAGRGTARA